MKEREALAVMSTPHASWCYVYVQWPYDLAPASRMDMSFALFIVSESYSSLLLPPNLAMNRPCPFMSHTLDTSHVPYTSHTLISSVIYIAVSDCGRAIHFPLPTCL